MKVSFFVSGEPMAQGRPRTRVVRMGRSSYAQIYNPHTADEWKAMVSILGRRAWDQGPIAGPIRLGATFFLPRPESHFKGKAHVLRVNAPLWHCFKPDSDNFIKAVLDALTGIVWVDDAQVCDQRTIKIYTNDTPGCQIEIEPIEITSCHELLSLTDIPTSESSVSPSRSRITSTSNNRKEHATPR